MIKEKFFKMKNKNYIGLIFLYLAALAGLSKAIEVEENFAIHVIENGTVDAVVLDCPYNLGEADEEGLVIYWLQENNPIPVYQWIQGGKPQATGVWGDRLDLGYKASEERFHIHRALRILNPTTELTGEYQCRISSFVDEKIILRKLIVYSRPESVRTWAEEEGEDNLKVVCEVDGIYPEPELQLNMMNEENGDRTILEGAQTKTTWSEGLYYSTLELVMDEDSLDGPTYFECDVTLPDTEVEVADTVYYEPRVYETAGAVVSGGESRSAIAVLICLAFLAILRV